MEYKISLRAARVNSHMLQKDVAKAVGVTKETVSNWESGKTAPKATVIMRLCDLYKVPIDAIILP